MLDICQWLFRVILLYWWEKCCKLVIFLHDGYLDSINVFWQHGCILYSILMEYTMICLNWYMFQWHPCSWLFDRKHVSWQLNITNNLFELVHVHSGILFYRSVKAITIFLSSISRNELHISTRRQLGCNFKILCRLIISFKKLTTYKYTDLSHL